MIDKKKNKKNKKQINIYINVLNDDNFWIWWN
jgi:hypothetical protein